MNSPSPAWKTVLMAGLLVGVLDATAAMVHSYYWHDVTPDRVWKFVASGAVGMAAFKGGDGMVVLGLFFHFLIAFGFTVTFFLLYPIIRPYAPTVFITGILWGLVVWAIMYFIVTPASSTPPRKEFDFVKALPQIGIHMFLVGLPMVWIIHRHYSRRAVWEPAA